MKKTKAVLVSLVLAACATGSVPERRPAEGPCVKLSDKDSLYAKPRILEGVSAIGDAPNDQELDLRVHLKLRNEALLDAFLDASSDPENPKYGSVMSPAEFAKHHLPREKDFAKVRRELGAKGLTFVGEPRGAVLYARTTVKKAKEAFKTELKHYRTAKGTHLRAPGPVVRLPEDLGIVAIHGLGTPPPRKTKHYRANDRSGYTANQVRAAYSVPATAIGKGQTVGVLELDGYAIRDIQGYSAAMGLPPPALTNINLGGYDGHVVSTDAQGEVTLDIQLINAMAPGAAIRVYAADQTTNENAFFDVLNEIANPTQGDKLLVRSISCSWGNAEGAQDQATLNAEYSLFKQMAAQGQTFFAASGDSGARDDGTDIGTDDPASQPYVVGVGGTRLTLNGTKVVSETAWSDGGGGVSCRWAPPSWAAELYPSGAMPNLRLVPDVAANADPETGYAVLVAGAWQTVGGTSCAAPLWSGILALANAERAANKKGPLSFAAPALYSTARAKKTGFRDITSGENGYYDAAKGYDLTTGWGSPKVDDLIKGLLR